MIRGGDDAQAEAEQPVLDLFDEPARDPAAAEDVERAAVADNVRHSLQGAEIHRPRRGRDGML